MCCRLSASAVNSSSSWRRCESSYLDISVSRSFWRQQSSTRTRMSVLSSWRNCKRAFSTAIGSTCGRTREKFLALHVSGKHVRGLVVNQSQKLFQRRTHADQPLWIRRLGHLGCTTRAAGPTRLHVGMEVRHKDHLPFITSRDVLLRQFPRLFVRRRLRLFHSPTDSTCTYRACRRANVTGRSRRTIPTTTRRARLTVTVLRSPGRTVTLTSVVYVFALRRHSPRSRRGLSEAMSPIPP